MNSAIKIFTLLILAVIVFGFLMHPALLHTGLSGTTSIIKQVQAG